MYVYMYSHIMTVGLETRVQSQVNEIDTYQGQIKGTGNDIHSYLTRNQ
jgi:hypothetical protein